MTIEATLQVKYGKYSYILMVKMIRVAPASYFFIRDKENERPLLSGKTLELTYRDSFSLTEFGGVLKSPGIPKRIVSAVQKGILDKRQTWLLGQDK